MDGARLANSLAYFATVSSNSSETTTSFIKPYSLAAIASIGFPLMMKSNPCLLGINLNNPAITINGQIPRFISGAENVAPFTAIAWVAFVTISRAPA